MSDTDTNPGTLNPRPGILYARELEDGYEVTVVPQMFNVRLCIGNVGADDYHDAYCYPNLAICLCAAVLWDGKGDPHEGWHKHIGSGRRRPGGDPEKEYIWF
jgi:hypothetical protein